MSNLELSPRSAARQYKMVQNKARWQLLVQVNRQARAGKKHDGMQVALSKARTSKAVASCKCRTHSLKEQCLSMRFQLFPFPELLFLFQELPVAVPSPSRNIFHGRTWDCDVGPQFDFYGSGTISKQILSKDRIFPKPQQSIKQDHISIHEQDWTLIIDCYY